MDTNMEGFGMRMKSDRIFRRRVLDAWKSGVLTEVLRAEGYIFPVEVLDQELPRVSTGLRAGGCNTSCGLPLE